VFISDIPALDQDHADEARRFTWLIDVLYDHRVKLVASAALPAEDLKCGLSGVTEFKRTISRLIEMRTHEYLATPHRRFETHPWDTVTAI
jgi:cell division protein ZapE